MTTKLEKDIHLLDRCIKEKRENPRVGSGDLQGGCILCEEYLYVCRKGIECESNYEDKCPIFEDTNVNQCRATPYYDVIHEANMGQIDHNRERMISYLKILKQKLEKQNDS